MTFIGDGSGRTALPPLLAYALSLAVAGVAVLVRRALDPLLGSQLPFSTPFIAVLLAAWYCGPGPALTTLFVGAVGASYFFVEPRFSFEFRDPTYRIALVVYWIVGLISIWLFTSLRDAWRQASEKGELLRITLASISDGVITTGVDGCVSGMNSMAEQLTGWKIHEATGQPLERVFCLVNEQTHQPAYGTFDELLRQNGGTAGHSAVVLLGREGGQRPVEHGAAAVRHDAGEQVGGVLVFRDVSNRRQQQRELEAREREFHMLAESIPQLAWMAAPDGDVFWYNRRWYEYTGTTLEQMQGWGWKAVHDPEQLPIVVAKWQAAIASGELFDMVFPIKGRDGAFRPFLTRVVPIKDPAGRVTRWFGTNTDITDQKRIEESLRRTEELLKEANRRKDEFLATLAHELRNPLAPVRNSLELMKLAKGNPGLIEQARHTMDRQIRQMVRLIDDLLDVSRITRDKLELKPERVELSTVVHQAAEACRPEFERAGHAFSVELPPEPISLWADPVRLAQVFGNLLTNACKYTERGGRISLNAVTQGSEVAIEVRDTGIGIPVDMLSEVFELFTQVDQSRQRSDGGLGIGLSLVKRLVQMHGGSVVANSDGPGMGSRFVVRLPLLEKHQDVIAPVAGSSRQGIVPKRRVLIVEDNEDSAASLAILLSLSGHEVQTAHDGQQAADKVDTFKPQLILLDIGLPKMSGYEVCRAIRAKPAGGEIVLVALTGWGQAEDLRRSKEAGFNAHMTKPVDPDALMELLASLSASAAIPSQSPV